MGARRELTPFWGVFRGKIHSPEGEIISLGKLGVFGNPPFGAHFGGRKGAKLFQPGGA